MPIPASLTLFFTPIYQLTDDEARFVRALAKVTLAFGLFIGAAVLATQGLPGIGLSADIPCGDILRWVGCGALLLATYLVVRNPPLPQPVSTDALAQIGNKELKFTEFDICWGKYRLRGDLSCSDNEEPAFLPTLTAYLEKVVLPQLPETATPQEIAGHIESYLQTLSMDTVRLVLTIEDTEPHLLLPGSPPTQHFLLMSWANPIFSPSILN